MDENGFIITNQNMETSLPGIFAAGDVRNTSLRQVITAVADGAVAATYADKYLNNLL
jgi:thioredoxin reductase (NADPH)